MSREEVRAVDRRALDELGMSGLVLMENAGRGAAELLASRGISGTVAICAGRGNNGGDGLVIARHLANRGIAVRTLCFCETVAASELATSDRRLTDFESNLRILLATGAPVEFLPPHATTWERLDEVLGGSEWIVDAMLGTGAQGPLRPPIARAIERINAARKRVLAVDLPSGLDCDSGLTLGPCVRAEQTATFVARKRGFDTPGSEEWTGAVDVIDIGVPQSWLERLMGQG